MEIGQKVSWIIGDKKREGIFKQMITSNLAEVICTKFETVYCSITCKVEKNILQIEE